MTNVIQITQLPSVSSLNGFEALEAVQAGTSVQITIAQIIALISPFSGAATSIPSRVVLTDATSNFGITDVALMINKTVPGATTVLLGTPSLGKLAIVKDMKGDSGTNAITIDAGSGNLINGLQTLVMNANYATTMLIGESATQWGTLI